MKVPKESSICLPQNQRFFFNNVFYTYSREQLIVSKGHITFFYHKTKVVLDIEIVEPLHLNFKIIFNFAKQSSLVQTCLQLRGRIRSSFLDGIFQKVLEHKSLPSITFQVVISV